MEIEKERGFGDYLMIISDGFFVRNQRLNPVSRATHLSSWRLRNQILWRKIRFENITVKCSWEVKEKKERKFWWPVNDVDKKGFVMLKEERRSI